MANQNRRSHAPGKTKRGKSFGEPRETRKFSRAPEENSDRQGRRYGKPQPGKPTRSHQHSEPKLKRFQEDETERREQRYPGKPKLGKPVLNQKAIAKVFHNRKAQGSSDRTAQYMSEADNGRAPAPANAKKVPIHKDGSDRSFEAPEFTQPKNAIVQEASTQLIASHRLPPSKSRTLSQGKNINVLSQKTPTQLL